MENQKTLQNKSLKSFLSKKWIPILVLLYVFSPIDLIPEGIFPFIGSVDDLMLVIAELARKWFEYRKDK